jgi:two-component system, OmpR family, sensor histidine kinase KdpD
VQELETMADLFINKVSKARQYLFSMLIVGITSAVCYALSTYMGYRVVAFILLVTVSLIAMIFDILPVLFTAVLTALIWDFFFIPPHFTFYVSSTEDLILLLMYFVIAMVNAVLTYKIRRVEKIARQKEEKANTLKLYDTLLNSLSHELRTPIATIIGATDNLQTNSSKLTPQNRHELIGEIAKASFRLNEQVENLLNMSRLESGFLEPKNDWCDINELVYQVVKHVEANAITQQIHININPDIPLFRLDKGMLEQVIYNLLNNATQYSPSNSRIDIMAMNYADVLHIVIEDEGNGFPESEVKNVFDKFYRLTNAKPGGTGLGLSIVKGFTEAMGGTVSLENRDGGGARFSVNILAKTSFIKNLKNE